MQLKDGFVLRSVAGETVVVPVGGDLDLNMMITLNDTGKLLWQRLESGATRQELTDALCTEFAVDRDTAAAHVDAFVAELAKNGFLR